MLQGERERKGGTTGAPDFEADTLHKNGRLRKHTGHILKKGPTRKGPEETKSCSLYQPRDKEAQKGWMLFPP